MVILEEAVQMSSISSRGIFRLIEEGRVHFLESDKGLILICPATLLKQSAKRRLGGRR